MSGIAGIVGRVEGLEYLLAAMMRSQGHRGECSDRGFWVSDFVEVRLGMAHCGARTSEVEEQVRQPYVDERTGLVVALEGDIYNYRALREKLKNYYTFATDSSVEVISKAYHFWGESFLHRLDGTFIIVIYDRRDEILFVARDRMGVKPLYYATHRGDLYFASEVRSLFAAGIGRQLSLERWVGYMLYTSYGPEGSTFWENVAQLPAGCCMIYNGYSIAEKRWYNLHDEVLDMVTQYSVEEMREMLPADWECVIEKSLADVAVCGVRVAGRIESQLLHKIAMQGVHKWKLHPFTGDIEKIGRQPIATPVWVTPHLAVSELERMGQWVEEPFDGCESVLRTIMFRQAHHDGVRVVCSGMGLDVLWQELWDGDEHRHDYLTAHPILARELSSFAVPPRYDHPFPEEADNMRYLELFYERIPHILRVFDRSASDTGVSVRIPFLDHELVALSFALPIASGQSRRKLFHDTIRRQYHCEIERDELLWVWPHWMQGGAKEWVGDTLHDLRCGAVRHYFEHRALDKLRDDFDHRRVFDIHLLWKCISLHRQLSQ